MKVRCFKCCRTASCDMKIKVYLDRSRSQSKDVAVNSESTCLDVIVACRGNDLSNKYYLSELCMGYERATENDERPLEILHQWGVHSDKVQFFLHKKMPPLSTRAQMRETGDLQNDNDNAFRPMALPPDILVGTEFSIEKLLQMAANQKEKLDEHQRNLAGKSERFSFLHQQQQRQKVQLSEKSERLNLLRQRLKEKEAKLMKLKSLKALVLEQGKTNSSISVELESVKNSFQKKELELSAVIAKMEALTKQLKLLHHERSNTIADIGFNSTKKEKLRDEILEYNLLNEQNAEQVRKKQKDLLHRQKQLAKFEEKLSKLRERLNLNKEKSQFAALNRSQRNEEINTKEQIEAGLLPLKSDAKYKTLPHGLKFTDVELMKSSDILDEKLGIQQSTSSPMMLNNQNKRNLDMTVLSGISSNVPMNSCHRPGSASEIQSSGKERIIQNNAPLSPSIKMSAAASKIVSDEPSVPTTKHSSYLLMSHFAPRPYESKYSSAKSSMMPVFLPSGPRSPRSASSKDSGITGEMVTGSVTNSISDSYEILITDPPALLMQENSPQGSSGSLSLEASATSVKSKARDDPTVRKMPGLEMTGDQNATVDPNVIAFAQSSKKESGPSESRSLSNRHPLSVKELEKRGRETQAQTGQPNKGIAISSCLNGEAVTAVGLRRDRHEILKVKDTSGISRSFDLTTSSLGANKISSLFQRKSHSFDETVADLPAQVCQTSSSNFQISVSDSTGAAMSVSKAKDLPSTPARTVRPNLQAEKGKLNGNTAKLSPSSETSISKAVTLAPSSDLKQKSTVTKVDSPKSYVSNAETRTDSHVRFPWGSRFKDQRTRLDFVPTESSSFQPGGGSPSSRLKSPELSSSSHRLKNDERAAEISDEKPEIESTIDPVMKQMKLSSDELNSKLENKLGTDVIKIRSDQPSSSQSTFALRYEPRNIRSDMYMRKLGARAMEQHSKSLDQLYCLFPTTRPEEEHSGHEKQADLTSKANEKDEDRADSFDGKSKKSNKPATLSNLESVKKTGLSSPPGAYECAQVTFASEVGLGISGFDAERQKHIPIIPRPVRRRMSSGDMAEDYPSKASNRDQELNSNQHTVVSDGSSLSTQNSPSNIFHTDSPDAEQKTDSAEKSSLPRQIFRRQGNLKRTGKPKLLRRVSFEPLALLLDASLEGELLLVEKTAREVPDVSASNDEGITALHNAICAGHFEIVKFLVEFGCDVNSPDSDGWTPLHCAASCNNLAMVQFLVEHGACIFATTFSDQELASDKCEEDEDGYDSCSQYLRDVQEKMGFANESVVYALFNYDAENSDELSFRSGDRLVVLRKGDDCEQEWWWSQMGDNEGYVPRNLVGMFPRVVPQWLRNVTPT